MLPQLATTYNPGKNYPNAQWLVSAKLDGVRCLCFDPSGSLMSRSLKLRYTGFEEIEQICQSLLANKGLSFLDGELYIPGERFDVISGIVRDRKNINVTDKLRVEYRIFAVGLLANPQMKAKEMSDFLIAELPTTGRVTNLPQSLILNMPSSIQSKAELVRSNGESNEGIMLRNPASVYSNKRGNDLVKVKNFVKGGFRVTGFIEGTGKYSKSLGSLLISGSVDGVNISGQVGSGFSDLMRSNIWQNQSTYLGFNIEVIYLGVTPNGKLRHPVFSQLI